MQDSLLLTKQAMDRFLKQARHNLRNDGLVVPVVILRLPKDQLRALALDLPETSDEKWLFFMSLGERLRTTYGLIAEAVFIADGWMVKAGDATKMAKLRPSQHPDRQEAITIIGRSADGSRYASLIQPYTRDEQKRPVFSKLLPAFYNEPVTKGNRPMGVLDALFTTPVHA